MATKEQVVAAAKKRGKTKEIDLGEGVKIKVRELPIADRKILDDLLWERGPDGNFVVLDKAGNPSADGEGYYKAKEGRNIRREWLLAAMEPKEAVDGILADDVPESVKREIYEAALQVNGIEPTETVAKN